jgi:hypothetical protein
MPIEYVPVLDENGDDVGGYTESVPDVHVKEEPDCYACNDGGCPQCDGSQIDQTQTITLTDGWPKTQGSWGGYSTESPF